AVLPILEPMPRPTRTLRWREPRGGRKFERLASVNGRDAAFPAGLRRLLLVFLAGLRPLETFLAIVVIPPLPRGGALYGSCRVPTAYPRVRPPDAFCAVRVREWSGACHRCN